MRKRCFRMVADIFLYLFVLALFVANFFTIRAYWQNSFHYLYLFFYGDFLGSNLVDQMSVQEIRFGR
jgi:hypothetical protein